MKREEKEVKTTVFNKVTVTEEERRFLVELVDTLEDLWTENEDDWRNLWTTEFDVVRKLAETGSYEIGD